MKNADIVRAWKNEEYRLSLSNAERAVLPENPAGSIELTDAELGSASGGNFHPSVFCTVLCTWYIGCTSVICPL
jgi:mersacidin/lichenicidin family type 2 lantibiotic